jgi:hypothetical protein
LTGQYFHPFRLSLPMIGPRNHVIPVVSQNLDFTANQFLSKTFAPSVRGYYYNQFTGDSGSGAILGDFQGESFGLGPGFIWFPEFAAGKLVVLGKWIHDFDATNRFESDYGTLTVAWTF